MKALIELLNQFEERIVEKEKVVHIQCEDVQQSINRTFHQVFEQLIEIRRFCRNDIEQQTLNIQVCSMKLLVCHSPLQSSIRFNYNKFVIPYNT